MYLIFKKNSNCYIQHNYHSEYNNIENGIKTIN